MPIATASPWRSRLPRQRLELVRGPVAEVERPRAAELERIAARSRCARGGARRRDGSARQPRPARRRRARRACVSSHAKNSGVADQRDLDRLGHARRPCRAGRASRGSRRSLSTANGGANVPRKFFAPKALTPFFTPTPESFCASTVVGRRTVADPAVRGRRGVAGRVEHRAAADDDHERLAVQPSAWSTVWSASERRRVVLRPPRRPRRPRAGPRARAGPHAARRSARRWRTSPGQASATARSTTTNRRCRRAGSFRASASTRSGFAGSKTSTVK